MENKKKKIIIVFLCLLSFFCSCNDFNLFSKSDKNIENKFDDLVSLALNDTNNIEIRLDTLTNFKWDSVLIITPYTDLNKLGIKTGIDFKELNNSALNVNEMSNVLAFISNNELIRFCELPNDKGYFDHYESIKYYTPKNAIFEIVKTNKRFTSGRNIVKVIPKYEMNNFIK
jgi:hypothetical protein